MRSEIGHFRIFECSVYVHVPSEKRTKFEPSGEKGIFVGYNETSKAYRVYIPTLGKTVVKRDVWFDESRAFKKSHDTIPVVAENEE